MRENGTTPTAEIMADSGVIDLRLERLERADSEAGRRLTAVEVAQASIVTSLAVLTTEMHTVATMVRLIILPLVIGACLGAGGLLMTIVRGGH